MAEKLFSIEGNRQRLDGGAMFGNAPKALWSRWIEADDKNRISLACRCLLIQSEESTILCETGIGAFFPPDLAARYGVESPERHLLLENLAEAGFRQEDINLVVLSHLHFDHAGGLLPLFHDIQAGRGELLFPNARYVVGSEAWARARNPHPRDRASFIPDLNQKLEDSGRLIIVDDKQHPEVLPDKIRFIKTSGHTPGQMHLLYTGENRKVFFCGDLVPGTPWLNVPLSMGYDRYPEKLIDEKLEVLKMAIAENWLLFYTHDPELAASACEIKAGGKYGPVHPSASLRGEAL